VNQLKFVMMNRAISILEMAEKQHESNRKELERRKQQQALPKGSELYQEKAHKEITDALALLKFYKEGWIKVEDMMPEEETRVLIIPKETGVPLIGFISCANSFWHGIFSDGIHPCDVESWLPIPSINPQ
jgi:hypothetical protein